MIRKILVVAAAIAMPASMLALVGGASVAGATKASPDPAVTCSLHGGTINFASPGLTTSGTLTSSKTEETTTSGLTLENSGSSTCSGTTAGQTITSKTGSCKTEASEYPVCSSATKTDKYAYDSQASFESASTVSAISKSLKSLAFTINGISYTAKTTSAASEQPGASDQCANSEAGFLISGKVSAPSNDKNLATSALICLGNVTAGSGGTVGQPFISAFLGLTSSQTIESVAIDDATSTIHVA